jgi:hypothetical protein
MTNGQRLANIVFTDVHPIFSAEGKVIASIRIPPCQGWPTGDKAQLNCEFIALSAAEKDSFFRDGQMMWDQENPQLVLEAMLVRRGQSDIAFRVGVASFNMEDWKAANPVDKFITLG